MAQQHVVKWPLTGGPRRMKINLVGNGTSVRSPNVKDVFSLTKAETCRSRPTSSPTKMLLASAFFGIFFMKWLLTCVIHSIKGCVQAFILITKLIRLEKILRRPKKLDFEH